MKFQVKFICKNGEEPGYVFRSELCHIGLVNVDEIRDEYNIPKFPLDSIHNNTTCSLSHSMEININEDVARRSGHFKDTTIINVNVPISFLTPYQKLEFIPNKNFPRMSIFNYFEIPKFWRRKIIATVGIYNKILTSDIIKDWEISGYPIDWNAEIIRSRMIDDDNIKENTNKKADQQYNKWVLGYGHTSPECVRWFLFVNLLPAALKPLVCDKTGGNPKLFADYKGERVRVVMASRFGDVGITKNLKAETGYSERLLMDELSNFSDEE